MKRSMKAARAKVEAEGACCRVCGNTFQVEAAHILARSRIRPGPAAVELVGIPEAYQRLGNVRLAA